MSELYRLVYTSKNLLHGTDAEIAAAVRQILEASQRNNVEADVTGALMFNAGAFAQVLEGPRRGVEETFERIQCDSRHGDVTVLQCKPAETRRFANWAMAFTGQSAEGRARFSGLAAESGFDLSRLDGDAVFAMLHELVLEEESARLADIADAATADEPHDAAGLDVAQLRVEIAQLRPGAAASRPAPAEARPGAGETSHEGAPRIAAAEEHDPQSLPGPHSLAAPEAQRPSGSATGAALQVITAALASERQRTSELRSEIDALRIELALSEDRLGGMERERDLWAERARLLATALAQEAGRIRALAQPSGGSDDRAGSDRTTHGLAA